VSLVGYPVCSKHGAMNKVSKDGMWLDIEREEKKAKERKEKGEGKKRSFEEVVADGGLL
jgi:hypothetical protein